MLKIKLNLGLRFFFYIIVTEIASFLFVYYSVYNNNDYYT